MENYVTGNGTGITLNGKMSCYGRGNWDLVLKFMGIFNLKSASKFQIGGVLGFEGSFFLKFTFFFDQESILTSGWL